jgi:copper transport protein
VNLTYVGWLAATTGAAMIGVDDLRSSGASLHRFVASTPGRHWEELLAVVSLTAFAVAAFSWRPRRTPLLVTGVLAALGMLARVDAGHAAGSSAVWFTVGTQWLHFLAVGAWIGALPWFVVLLHRTPPDGRRALGRRFSLLATAGIGVVAITGTLRAVDEVSAWDQLIHNSFGRTVLVKIGLFLVIAAVGAVNHFVLTRRLPAASGTLRRAVRAEIGVGVVAVLATGLLTGLAPASSVAAAASRAPETKPLAVEGHDYGTTTRVRLEVSPGLLGPNRFTATITDYDSGQPVDATAVKLRFALASRPDLGNTSLDLRSVAPGKWEGSSPTMALAGVWDVTAVISGIKGGLEVPLRVRPDVPGQKITASPNPGQPTIYDIYESDGTHLQAYVDPGRTGANTLHLTMFDAAGSELPVDTVDAVAFGPDGGAQPLQSQRLGPGHFAAAATLTAGTWTYAVTFGGSAQTYTALFDDPTEGP